MPDAFLASHGWLAIRRPWLASRRRALTLPRNLSRSPFRSAVSSDRGALCGGGALCNIDVEVYVFLPSLSVSWLIARSSWF